MHSMNIAGTGYGADSDPIQSVLCTSADEACSGHWRRSTALSCLLPCYYGCMLSPSHLLVGSTAQSIEVVMALLQGRTLCCRCWIGCGTQT